MALEAVVFPQEQLACASTKAAVFPALHPPALGSDVDIGEFEDKGGIVLQNGGAAAWDAATCCTISACGGAVEEFWDEKHCSVSSPTPPPLPMPALCHARGGAPAGRRRRRRAKAAKNKEEVENQRRNHIAVERNRRRQMNEYLAVLRSAMPPSYAQRGDQASIVGGAINFVKELEQLLQSLEAQKRRAVQFSEGVPFAGFFTFPQYSTAAAAAAAGSDSASSGCESGPGARPGVADIEVAVAESHANVKVLAPRRPRQLLRMVVGLQCLGLAVLHLNVTTTLDQMVLYSFSLKMEDQCRLSSIDEIAAAVHEMVAKIDGECVS